jgi:hypothetical protein
MINYRKLSEHNYLSADVNFLIDDPNITKSRYISIVLLILWMVSLPILFVYVVKKRDHQNIFRICMKIFGFLFEEYKKKSLYWEILKLLILKYLIIIMNELAEESVITRTNCVISFCFAYYLLLCNNKPYKSK